jgi:hypothetical protein
MSYICVHAGIQLYLLCFWILENAKMHRSFLIVFTIRTRCLLLGSAHYYTLSRIPLRLAMVISAAVSSPRKQTRQRSTIMDQTQHGTFHKLRTYYKKASSLTSVDYISDDSTVDCSSDSFSASYSRSTVRFQLDEYNEIVRDVYEYDAIPEDLKKKCYLTTNRIVAKKRSARSFCTLYAQLNPDYVDSIACVFDSPLQHQQQPPTNDRNKADACQLLAVSEARGLERHINSVVTKYQRHAIQAVVARFRQLQACEISPEQVGALLRKRSLELTKCSKLFALQLAAGDQVEARRIHCGGYEC